MLKLSLNQPVKVPAICVLFIIILNACNHSIPSPTSTLSSTPNPTIIPTHTSTPTPPPPFSIVPYTGPYAHELLHLDLPFSDLKTGIYYLRSDGDSLYYGSTVGIESGKLGDFSSPPGYYDLNRYEYIGDSLLYLAQGEPRYTGVGGRLERADLGGPGLQEIAEMLINSVGLSSGYNQAWWVNHNPESGMHCNGLSLSPDLDWIAGNCWQDGENYIYLINIPQQVVRTIRSSEHHCLSEVYGEAEWTLFDWSLDGDRFSAVCGNETRRSSFLCLISPDTGEFGCRNPADTGFVYAFSPDGLRVAMVGNGGIAIVDQACVRNSDLCDPEILIPYINSIGGVIWNSTGTKLISSMYMEYPLTGQEPGFASIGIADTMTDSVTYIDGPRGANVIAISPDDRWILIVDRIGYGLLSSDGQILRRLPDGFGWFLGWLVIP